MVQSPPPSLIRAVALLTLAVAALLAHVTAAGAAQQIGRANGFNGTVYALAQDPSTGDVVAGGAFTAYQPWDTGFGAVVDATTGEVDSSFPKIGGDRLSDDVRVAAPDGAGGFFIGGSFRCVGGDGGDDGDCTDPGEYPRAGLAHLDADGAVDPAWDPTVTGGSPARVHAMAVSGGRVYIGGQFTAVAGQTRRSLAALDAATGDLTAWAPDSTCGPNVYALAVDSGLVYVGGNFSSCPIGGQTRTHLAAIDAGTGLATSWDPNPNNEVDAITISGGTLYVGGRFTQIDSTTRNRIAAFDPGTGHVTSWNPNANSDVTTIAAAGSTLYVGGNFTAIGGQSRSKLASLSTSTGLAGAWAPTVTTANGVAEIRVITVDGSAVRIGGQFTSMAGVTRNGAAAVDASGTLLAWDPNATSATGHTVHALAVGGGRVYVGGDFVNAGGTRRGGIAKLDAAGDLASWAPNADSTVYALAISGSVVYAGGDFAAIGGQSRNRIAALDASGAATTWNPNANDVVKALAIDGATVYAGGNFTAIGGQTRNRIAALDASGTATAWNPNADSNVLALAIAGAVVYAGGDFATIGGQTRNRIAALDASGAATAWNPNADDEVRTIAVQGSDVYAGGWFTAIGGQSRPFLAAVSTSTGLATSWNPSPDQPVYATALSGSTLYAGGYFTTVGGQPRALVGAVDTATGATAAWDAGITGDTVDSLAIGSGVVYVGGAFSVVNSSSNPLPRRNIAAINATTGTATTWSAAVSPPGSPTGVSVTPAQQQATVTWTPPAFTGASPITSYVVTAAPGVGTCTATAPALSCIVTGLTTGAAYTFSVVAINASGPGAASEPSAAVTIPAASTDESAVSAATPATATAGSTSARRVGAPALALSPGETRIGIRVERSGVVRVAIRCPAGNGPCVVSGTLATASPSALRTRTTILARFHDVHIDAGGRRTVELRIAPAILRLLQAREVRVLPATITLDSSAPAGAPRRVQRLRLRIPDYAAPEPVTG